MRYCGRTSQALKCTARTHIASYYQNGFRTHIATCYRTSHLCKLQPHIASHALTKRTSLYLNLFFLQIRGSRLFSKLLLQYKVLTWEKTFSSTLQMFTGIYKDSAGKSECGDFKFMGIPCIPAIPVILKSPHSDFHVKNVGILTLQGYYGD